MSFSLVKLYNGKPVAEYPTKLPRLPPLVWFVSIFVAEKSKNSNFLSGNPKEIYS